MPEALPTEAAKAPPYQRVAAPDVRVRRRPPRTGHGWVNRSRLAVNEARCQPALLLTPGRLPVVDRRQRGSRQMEPHQNALRKHGLSRSARAHTAYEASSPIAIRLYRHNMT